MAVNQRLLLCAVFLFCSIPSFLSAQGKWYKLGTPSAQELTKLAFLDSLKGFAAGDSGTLIKTTDGGRTWAQVPLGIHYPIYELFFLDKKYGWASAWKESLPYGTIILKTTNGGETWSMRDYPENYTFIESIQFFDSLNGVIGGLYGYFARTSDGGNTWKKSLVDTTSFAYFPVIDFSFRDRKRGFAYGGHIDIAGVIWSTVDSGKNWFGVPASPEPIRGMHFINEDNIVAVGGDFEYGTSIIRSANGGVDWEYTNLEVMGVGMTLRARTPNELWVPLGFTRKFLVSYDAGRSWVTQDTPDSSIIFDIQFIDSTLGYAVGPLGEVLKFSKTPVLSVKEPEKGTTGRTAVIYPHPVTEKATVIPGKYTGGTVTLELYTITGQLVMRQEYEAAGQAGVIFRRPEKVAGGVYLLSIISSAGRELKTIILR